MAYGFRPISNKGSDEVTPTNEYELAATASAIYKGDGVKQLTDGTLDVAAAGNLIIGIFSHCTYFDAAGVYHVSPRWPADAAATNIKAYVWDDPSTKFEVLANAAVTQANVGALYDFSYAAGSAVNGVSGVTLDIASLGLTDKAFRMTGLTNRVGDSALVVQGFFVEHALLGISAGAGGI